jgi:5-dehydro-2-deoxygluconokinase
MDVISVGRVSVDLYAVEPHAGFETEQSFQKSIGGSPTNVAIAAAQLGLNVAMITRVGDDDFGDYVISKLQGFGVDTRFISKQAGNQTPLAFASLTPPESPKVIFYRGTSAPDTSITFDSVPSEDISEASVLWISQSNLATGETAKSSLAWMRLRNPNQHTILDLDYRPSLWPSEAAARSQAQEAISLATVVVGNLAECRVALGDVSPEQACDELLSRGVQLAIVKLGADGVLLATREKRIQVTPVPIKVVCGLGAGDAFGGALCFGLLNNWEIEKIGEFANAAGALVSTKLTCAEAMPTLPELGHYLESVAS